MTHTRYYYIFGDIYNNMNASPISIERIDQSTVDRHADYFNIVFKKLGYNFNESNLLGYGEFGIAFLVNGITVKITKDKAEAELCNKIKGKHFKTICDIYSVFEIGSSIYSDNMFKYIITKEYVGELDADTEFAIEDIYYNFRNQERNMKVGNFDEFLRLCNEGGCDSDIVLWYLDLCNEMRKNNIWIKDPHEYNIGKRNNGDLVIFDLGLSSVGDKSNNTYKNLGV